MSASRKRRVGRRIALVSALVALIATACGQERDFGAAALQLALVRWSENDQAGAWGIEYRYISPGLLDER
jgi:hypothetical protein